MPVTRIWRGDSIPIAQVVKLTPSQVVVGDTFTVTCNGKSIYYTAKASTAADVVGGLGAALVANASSIPEFTEFTATTVLASPAGPSDGSYILLTAATPGVPFKVTTSTQVTTAGNVTVAETTPGKLAVNEAHQISLVGTYTGGTFTITYSFGTTAAIAYNATAATVQSALAALAGVGAGNVLVTGGPGPASAWFVTWTGTLGGQAIATGTINGASLTGNAGITISEQTRGNGASNCVQGYSIPLATGGSYTLTLNGQTTAAIAQNATPATVQTAIAALPNVGTGNVAVYGKGGGTGGTFGTNSNADYYFVVFQGALGGINVPALTLNPGNLAGNSFYDAPTILQVGGQTTADEFQVIDLGAATGGTFTLGYGTQVSSPINVFASNATTGLTVRQTVAGAVALLIGSGNPNADIDCWDVSQANGDLFENATAACTNFLVHFKGAFANTVMQLMTVNNGGLTGLPTCTVTRAAQGKANQNEVWSIYTNAGGGTFTLTLASQTTGATAFNATTGTLQTNIQSAFTNSLTAVTVSGAGTLASPWLVTVTAPANTQLGPPTGSGASLTGGGGTITELTHGAAGVNEVQTVTIAAGATGGTFTLTFNGATTANINWNDSAATVQTRLTALTTVNTVTVAGAAGGPYTVTWSGAQGNAPQNLLIANGAGITGITGSQALVLATQTPSSGPNHFNDPLNWTGDVVPNSLEAIVFDPASSNVLYGLTQITTFTANAGTNVCTWTGPFPCDLQNGQAVYVSTPGTLPSGLSASTLYYPINVNYDAQTCQLATTPGGAAVALGTTGSGTLTMGVRAYSIEENARYTGQIGNPRENTNGYYEYRPLYLHIGLATLANGGAQTVTIGTDQGGGSGKTQIDTDVDLAVVSIIQTGGSSESGVAAFVWKGQNTSNTISLINGDMSIAPFPGETALIGATAPAIALAMRGGTLELGGGVTITGPINKTAGTLTSDGASITGSCLLRQ